MPNLKSSFICKALAMVLCVFLAFEVSYLQAYQATDQMNQQFNAAKEAYFADDFEGAKATLESLVSSIAQLEGMDSFKGEVYLLLGAAYEKLEFNNLAIKYFCLAKDILGEEKTIEGLDLNSLTLYWTQCQTAGGVAVSILIIQYEDGYRSYLAGDYEGSKVILERLVSTIDTLEGFESLKGETYLVLAAAYEALKYKELSIKYYCQAKAILGVGVTVDGIRLSKLRWYKAKCPTGAAAARVVVRERRGGGGFIGFLLGLGVLAGLIWYLFINKNSPLKKDDEGGGGSDTHVYTASCFTTTWEWHISATFSGSLGSIDLVPNPVTAMRPKPTENNNWADTFNFEIQKNGGGALVSLEVYVDFTTGGGWDVEREDIIFKDGTEVKRTKNTWNNDCDIAPGTKKLDRVATWTTLGNKSIGHTVVLKDTAGNVLNIPISTFVNVTKK
ncbi:hypothetical protein ACFLRW_03030 [Acidobacteriota bacterium]